ncbi:hypothetical protein [Streptomyces violascens]
MTRVFKPDPAEKGRRGDVARLAALTPDQLPPPTARAAPSRTPTPDLP